MSTDRFMSLLDKYYLYNLSFDRGNETIKQVHRERSEVVASAWHVENKCMYVQRVAIM